MCVFYIPGKTMHKMAEVIQLLGYTNFNQMPRHLFTACSKVWSWTESFFQSCFVTLVIQGRRKIRKFGGLECLWGEQNLIPIICPPILRVN